MRQIGRVAGSWFISFLWSIWSVWFGERKKQDRLDRPDDLPVNDRWTPT